MCEVSDKLKLCSCAAVNPRDLRHYWILHRFDKGKSTMVVGMFMLPHILSEEIEVRNKNLLLTLLNQPDTFDKNIIPRQGDLLELSFSCGDDDRKITYGFKYNRGKWQEEGFDPLVWMWHHDEEQYGKIKNALKRNNRAGKNAF